MDGETGGAAMFGVPPSLTGRYQPRSPLRELPFWHRDELTISQCRTCGLYLHPPLPRCRRCQGDDIVAAVVPGRGSIFSFTVNHQPWDPDLEVPYVVAVIELDAQPGLRLTSNIVDAVESDLAIGRRVVARHVPVGDLMVPVFAIDPDPDPDHDPESGSDS